MGAVVGNAFPWRKMGRPVHILMPKPEVRVASPNICILNRKEGVRSPEQGAMAGSFQLCIVCVPGGCLLPRGPVNGRASPFHFRKGYRAILLKELHQGLRALRDIWVKLGCFVRIWISEDVLFSFFELKFNLSN